MSRWTNSLYESMGSGSASERRKSCGFYIPVFNCLTFGRLFGEQDLRLGRVDRKHFLQDNAGFGIRPLLEGDVAIGAVSSLLQKNRITPANLTAAGFMARCAIRPKAHGTDLRFRHRLRI